MAERRPAIASAPTRARRLVDWCLRTRALDPVRLSRQDWIYLTLVIVLSRVAIVLLGVLGAAMFPHVGPNQTWALQPINNLALDNTVPGSWMHLFVNFDSGWYLGISKGYTLPSSGNPDWLREWAFFPGYPWVLHPVAVVLSWLHVPGNTAESAGVLVSYAALYGGGIYLYRLVRGELGAAAARRSLVYLLIFPASFYLSTVYPEGLFFFLSVGAFYHTRRRQWAAAGVLAAWALLTRAQGAFLILPLGIEFIAAYRAGEFKRALAKVNVLWLGLPVLALGGYALFSHANTGYWLAFEASAKVWGRRLTPPIYPLAHYLLSPSFGSAFSFDFASLNFAVAVLFIVLAVVAFFRLPLSYVIWLALGVLIPLSSGGHQMTSLARYAAPFFPAFMALAAWSLRIRWTPGGPQADALANSEAAGTSDTADLRDRFIVIPFLMLLALCTIMFANGVWAAV